jgi:hypothetical protein
MNGVGKVKATQCVICCSKQEKQILNTKAKTKPTTNQSKCLLEIKEQQNLLQRKKSI